MTLEKKWTRRTLDRVHDIEYYTNEELGPQMERTPEGFLVCFDVPMARTGEMIYGPGEVPDELGVGDDGRIKIYRRPEVVFDRKSMASINGKPLTDDHPPVDVDPKNWRFYTRGVVMSPHRGEGKFKDCLMGDVIIYDEDTIRDVEMGKREVSCGYNPDYAQILRDSGEPIKGIGEQQNIIYNHLALVEKGRCGVKCAIRDHKTVDKKLIVSDEALRELEHLRASSFWSDRQARRLERLARQLG